MMNQTILILSTLKVVHLHTKQVSSSYRFNSSTNNEDLKVDLSVYFSSYSNCLVL
jgi:hypothetical protein